MPKSKRDKKVSLTQTKKKGLEAKKKLVAEIKDSIDKYEKIFIISLHDSRNSKLKDVRHQWSHSRFFFGKNKVMMLALGKNSSEEILPNLHKLTKRLHGQTGLLFTNQSEEDVISWFSEYTCAEYARSGNVCPYSVTIAEGFIPSFCHSLEPQLRQLGLPTSLEKGVISILKSFNVCSRGSQLNPEQARILKLFGHKMAKFKIKLEAVWTKGSHKVKSLNKVESLKTNLIDNSNTKDVTIIPENLSLDNDDGIVDENDSNEMIE